MAVAAPLPALWIVVRGFHNRSNGTGHDVVGLVQPAPDNLWYYTVVAIALVGLAALPLYLVGFLRLVGSRGSRLSPWTQAVVFPCLSLALFFALLYDWADKRFLYYLFPFAVAIAAEGVAMIVAWGRRSRPRTALATLGLTVVLLWNRIPYPATSHRLLALSPLDFVDLTQGLRTDQMHSVPSSWPVDLLRTDGFLSFRRRQQACSNPQELAATAALRRFIDERLAPGGPIGFAGTNGDSTSYWVDTNRLAIALERPVVKPELSRFVLRHLVVPHLRALATFGPFELFDRQALATLGAEPRRPKHKRRHKTGESRAARRGVGRAGGG